MNRIVFKTAFLLSLPLSVVVIYLLSVKSFGQTATVYIQQLFPLSLYLCLIIWLGIRGFGGSVEYRKSMMIASCLNLIPNAYIYWATIDSYFFSTIDPAAFYISSIFFLYPLGILFLCSQLLMFFLIFKRPQPDKPKGERIKLSNIYTGAVPDKSIKTNYDLEYLQEMLSCPTCKYADREKCLQLIPWCQAPSPPNIVKNYCYTFQPAEEKVRNDNKKMGNILLEREEEDGP